MAKIDYDPVAGLRRLGESVKRQHSGVGEILVYHLAVEREVGVVLDRLVPYPEHIRSMSYGNKLKVLRACWRGHQEAGQRLAEVLERFNQLRNAVAHGDDATEIAKGVDRLRASFALLVPRGGQNDISVASVAAGVIGFLADDPPVKSIALQKVQLGEAARALSTEVERRRR